MSTSRCFFAGTTDGLDSNRGGGEFDCLSLARPRCSAKRWLASLQLRRLRGITIFAGEPTDSPGVAVKCSKERLSNGA